MNPKQIRIGDREIGEGCPPFVIAEMSGNHNKSFDRAMAIIDAAAAVGVDAIKLQTYTPDTISIKGAMVIQDESSPWHNRELYDLYTEAHTPWEWTGPLFQRAREKGLIAFSSPFDPTAVDFLEKLSVPVYKIASFENTDWLLLRKVARTGKPVIMSTGVATLAEIDEAVRLLKREGCRDIVLLKCTSTYPASPRNTNLRTIPCLADTFSCAVGLSDHTMGVGAAVAAVALGACLIEKHFTLARTDGGVDSAFSLEPAELALLVTEVRRAWEALGRVQIGVQADEEKNRQFKRSLYLVRDLGAGEVITADAVASFRPALGIETRHIDVVVGRRVRLALRKGTPLRWEHF